MLVAILLAAGDSRRMGRAKLELELGGMSLVARSLRNLLDAGVDLVRVVVAPRFNPSGLPEEIDAIDAERVAIVVNSDRDGGLSSSMRAGLRELPGDCEMILVALADMPLVETSTIRTLIDTFDRHRASVVYPTFQGQQGHPVLFDASLASELFSVVADRGAKSVIERHRDAALAVEVDDAGVCLDVDTPEDFERAADLFERRRARDAQSGGCPR